MAKRTIIRLRVMWSEAVLEALQSCEQPVPLATLYRLVEARAPEHVAANPHWRDKVRQVVQRLRAKGLVINVAKGVWQAVRDETEAPDQAASAA